jgi:glycosyltransferase involved in cell wall biosynthesis
MTVSVVVITCDGARWVAEQARSIASQTRPPDEVIVADDASTDDTVAITREALAPLRDRVRILLASSRLGVTANLERAIRAATGDVIVLADQDDVWLPDKLDTVARWARHETTGAMFSNGWIIDADGTRTGEQLWARAGFSTRAVAGWDRDPLAILLRQPVVTGATMALRRAALDLVLPLPGVGWHDYAMSLVLAATSGLTKIDEPLVEYRLHGANTAGLQAPRRRDRVESPEAHRANLQQQDALFRILADRLTGTGHPDAARRMVGKVEVLHARAALPDARIARIAGVTRLTVSGGYARYGQGLSSAARDLLWP